MNDFCRNTIRRVECKVTAHRVFTFNTSLLTFLISFLFLSPSLLSQPISFKKTFGGSQSDYCFGVTPISDSGYVLVGNSYSFSQGFDDAYIVKVNAIGKTLWTTSVGWSGNEDARAIVELSNNVLLAIGTTSSKGKGSKDILGVWLNQYGDTLWTRTYGKKNADVGFDVIKSAENCLITGVTRDPVSEKSDIYFININENGDTIFTKTYGGKENETGFGSLVTQQGDYMIVGTSSTSSRGDNDIYIVRVDENGNKIWEKNYGTLNADRAVSIVQFNDSIFYLTGAIRYNGEPDYDLFVMRINGIGDSLWLKSYGDTLFDEGNNISVSKDGNLLVMGTTQSYGAGNKDMIVLKISPEGELLNQQTYGGAGSDEAITGFQTSDGGILLAGYTSSYGEGGADMFLVKTLPDWTLSFEENNFLSLSKKYFTICTGNELIINFDSGVHLEKDNIHLIDITGKKIEFSMIKENGYLKIPINKLNCGMYLYRIIEKNGTSYFGKFVK